MCLLEAQRMDLIFNFVHEIGAVHGGLRGCNGVPVMEAVGKGDEGDEGDECLYFFVRACEEEIGVD